MSRRPFDKVLSIAAAASFAGTFRLAAPAVCAARGPAELRPDNISKTLDNFKRRILQVIDVDAISLGSLQGGCAQRAI
jgi:hypothetical protein